MHDDINVNNITFHPLNIMILYQMVTVCYYIDKIDLLVDCCIVSLWNCNGDAIECCRSEPMNCDRFSACQRRHAPFKWSQSLSPRKKRSRNSQCTFVSEMLILISLKGHTLLQGKLYWWRYWKYPRVYNFLKLFISQTLTIGPVSTKCSKNKDL